MNFDAVLLIAFGGPNKFEEVRPFLSNVLRGHPVLPERLETVVEQYRAIGGASPITRITFQQAKALKTNLASKNSPLKVYVGMRNWFPTIQETLEQMRKDGVKRAIGIILAPHRCEASWQRYQLAVSQSQEKMGSNFLQIEYIEPWHNHPLFVQAISDSIEQTLSREKISTDDEKNYWIFTAHSIPISMDKESGYSAQVFETASAIAKKWNKKNWSLAYQSRSGRPADPWLEPDINKEISKCSSAGVRSVLVIPVGFVSDHVEVLYDLDIQAKKSAEELGMKFLRAKTVADHPKFIQMFAELVNDSCRARIAR